MGRFLCFSENDRYYFTKPHPYLPDPAHTQKSNLKHFTLPITALVFLQGYSNPVEDSPGGRRRNKSYRRAILCAGIGNAIDIPV